MFSKFSEEAQKVLMGAKEEMIRLKHPYVGSEHLLLSILKNKSCDVTRHLLEYQIDYQTFYDEVVAMVGVGQDENRWFLYTPLLKRVLENAMLEARENHDEEVGIHHLFLSMLEEGEGVAVRILLSQGVDIDSMYQFFYQHPVVKSGKSTKKLMIDEFAVDFVERAKKGEIDPVVCRDSELSRLIETLSRRSKNNPILIGEAGVGKTAIVEELARRISLDLVPEKIRGTRVLSLSIAGLVAGTKYRGEFEERLNKLLKEVEENSDIILFVDEIHTLVGAGGAEGAIDASNILKPILARGKIRLIGATTTQEYKQFIEKDKAFARRFQTILVEEPDLDKTMTILQQLSPLYEGYHHVVLKDSILSLVIKLSDMYIFNRRQPDKSIDLLDEVCAKVSLQEDKDFTRLSKWKNKLLLLQEEKNHAIIEEDFKKAGLLKEKEQRLEDRINRLELKMSHASLVRVVEESDVYHYVEEKTNIPVYENDFGQNFSNLESELKKVVIGQDDAVLEVCNELKREHFGLHQTGKPSSFLFVGPTGVGKTKLVKEYAKRSVGEEHFIRLDMSEYRESHSISKIIGAPPGYVGYTDSNSVLEQIRTYPYSVLLLDEIEKAHPSVVQLFLQALDEGRMKTSQGEVVRFDHVKIFMTSNIGCNQNSIGFSKEKEDSIHSKLKEILSIEFLNRIHHVILFSPFSHADMLKIIDLELKNVKKTFMEKGISLSFQPSILEEVLTLSQYEEFGARKVSSIIEKKIDTLVIDQILEGHHKIKLETIM